MDINPRRTMATVGVAVLLSGGILYYQYASYSPSSSAEIKKTTEATKKAPGAAAPTPDQSGTMPALAQPKTAAGAAPSASPAILEGLLGVGTGYSGDRLTPKMEEALKKKIGTTGGQTAAAGGSKSGGSNSGGGTSGGSGGSSSQGGGGSSNSGGGGSSSGAASSPTPAATQDSGYWLEDGTQIRHNSGCELYKQAAGTPCGKSDGTACRLCGG